MKINPAGKKAYQQIKQELNQKLTQIKQDTQEKIKEAKEYAAPKLKEAGQKAADWTDEKIKDTKDAYKTVKQKVQPKVDEFISNAQYAMNPPKLEVLGKKMTSLQKQYLFKSAFLNELKRKAPEQAKLISQKEKELQILQQKAQEATEKYNKFAAQQAAAQRAFELLNGIKK